MANWCGNSIAFFQDDGGNMLVEAFYADIQKYMEYREPGTGRCSDWVGHWLEANRIDLDSIYSRGFFRDCELYSDHVLLDMETAWAPLPEVYDKMAGELNQCLKRFNIRVYEYSSE
jgi:hypothetical protein